jgi:predicted glycogen debranching enzyme
MEESGPPPAPAASGTSPRPAPREPRALPPLEVPSELCSDLREGLRREWLETNGLGSFACGTVAGAATRRYHALLCTATRPPVARMVLVNDVEATLLAGGERHELSTHVYPGTVQPEGYRALAGFRLDPWPIWTWRFGGLTVERELFMPHGVQATVIRWRARSTQPMVPATLVVRPLCSGRDYHALHHENGELSASAAIDERLITVTPYPGVPTVRMHHNGRYLHEPIWYRRFQLPIERERGLDYEEDLFSFGEIHYSLGDGDQAELILATDGRRWFDAAALAATERARRAQIAQMQLERTPGNELAARLATAADQFVVARGGGSTVIAGYPWFTDWGRDTFIALPGLALTTGRRAVAREVLAAFAPYVSQGMIPNRFPDQGEAPEYNSVDAPLWYAIAVGRFAAQAGDDPLVRDQLWPAVRAIVEGYRRGTRYGIVVDGDGLVRAGAPGVQLTWMDAKVGDWVVTPRSGKPIEIQALWIRALRAACDIGRRLGERALTFELELAERRACAALASRYWHEQGGYFCDVIDGDARDASLRPNQLYALALDPGVLDHGQAAHALDAVERHLLTPVGLRTLAPGDGSYRGRCLGSQRERDAAYHQGTVWPHLLGVYADACYQVRRERVGRKLAQRMLPHLTDAGIGQVSEIFDGDAPHEPRGCFAQAWAVAELLRLAAEGP